MRPTRNTRGPEKLYNKCNSESSALIRLCTRSVVNEASPLSIKKFFPYKNEKQLVRTNAQNSVLFYVKEFLIKIFLKFFTHQLSISGFQRNICKILKRYFVYIQRLVPTNANGLPFRVLHFSNATLVGKF